MADLAAADVELNKLTAEVMFSDASFVRRGLGHEATDADVERWQRRLRADLHSGAIEFSSDRTRQLTMLLGALGHGVKWLIGTACWTVLEAEEGSEFVLSDAPVAQYDPDPKFDGAGAGFASSAQATSIVPIDRSVALMFRPSPDGLFKWTHRAVSSAAVADVNALIYAQADECIYGSSVQLLETVRGTALEDPERQDRYRRRRMRIWVSRVDAGEAPDVDGARTFKSTNRDGTVERTLRVTARPANGRDRPTARTIQAVFRRAFKAAHDRH